MIYYLTNVIFGICALLMLAIPSWLERKALKILNIKTLVLIAMLVALSVVLTNFIGYAITIFGIKVMLGNFLIFLCGVLFGPFFGVVAGFASDLVGSFVFISGQFHFGFMVAKMLVGLLGGFVFLPKNNKLWQLRIILYLTLGLSISTFVITPIALASTIGWEMVLATYWKKLVTLPTQIAIYTPIVFTCTSVAYILLRGDVTKRSKPWFLKNNEIIIFWKRKN